MYCVTCCHSGPASSRKYIIWPRSFLTFIFNFDVNKGWWPSPCTVGCLNGAVVGGRRRESTKGYATSFCHRRQGRERARNTGDSVNNNFSILEVWLRWLPREHDLSCSTLFGREAEWWPSRSCGTRHNT